MKKSVFNGEIGQTFSLRKYTIGLCSVMLGSFLLMANAPEAHADTVSDSANQDQAVKVDKDALNKAVNTQKQETSQTSNNVTTEKTQTSQDGQVNSQLVSQNEGANQAKTDNTAKVVENTNNSQLADQNKQKASQKQNTIQSEKTSDKISQLTQSRTQVDQASQANLSQVAKSQANTNQVAKSENAQDQTNNQATQNNKQVADNVANQNIEKTSVKTTQDLVNDSEQATSQEANATKQNEQQTTQDKTSQVKDTEKVANKLVANRLMTLSQSEKTAILAPKTDNNSDDTAKMAEDFKKLEKLSEEDIQNSEYKDGKLVITDKNGVTQTFDIDKMRNSVAATPYVVANSLAATSGTSTWFNYDNVGTPFDITVNYVTSDGKTIGSQVLPAVYSGNSETRTLNLPDGYILANATNGTVSITSVVHTYTSPIEYHDGTVTIHHKFTTDNPGSWLGVGGYGGYVQGEGPIRPLSRQGIGMPDDYDETKTVAYNDKAAQDAEENNVIYRRQAQVWVPTQHKKGVKEVVSGDTLVTNYDETITWEWTQEPYTTGGDPYSSIGYYVTGPNPDRIDDRSVTFVVKVGIMHHSFTYVDSQDNKQVGQTVSIQGKSGETVNTGLSIPANYELADGQTLPSTFTFNGADNQNTVIKLKHKLNQIYHNITYPDSKQVARSITINQPNGNGGINAINKNQTVTLTRTVQQDAVTGQYICGDWSTVTFGAVQVPQFAGYTASRGDIGQETARDGYSDPHIVVNYTANHAHVNYQFYDDETHQNVGGAIGRDGVTDQTISTNLQVPNNYEVVTSVPTSHKFSANENDTITLHVRHKRQEITDASQTTSHVARKVTIIEPSGRANTTMQQHDFTRHVDRDLVRNQLEYGAWSDNGNIHFDSVNVPGVAGYTVNGSAPAIDMHPGDGEREVTITYKANPQSVVLQYKDAQNQIIGTQTLNGVTDQTINVTANAPEHWVFTNPNSVLRTYKFKAQGNSPIDIYVEHKLDPAPDDVRTVQRQVNITTPDGKTSTTNQIVTFRRTTQTDEVTNKPVYGAWSENGQHVFLSVNPNVIDGYAINGSAGQETVTPDSAANEVVNITYKALAQSSYYQFVDDDYSAGAPDISMHHAISGVTDQTVKLGIQIPNNYHVASGQTVPDTYTFKARNNNAVIIHLKHNTQDKTTDPSEANNVKKTIVRDIVITNPDNKQTTQQQSAVFTRSATKDLVTGKISYSAWNKDGKIILDSVNIPQIDGYTSHVNYSDNNPTETSTIIKSVIATPNSNNFKANVTYTANPQESNLQFVDGDLQNSAVSVIKLNGVTDQTINIDAQVPHGYVLGKGQSIPKTYTFKAENNNPVVVVLTHEHINVTDPSETAKAVTRTVEIDVPNDKPQIIMQNVTFNRTAYRDGVSGLIIHGQWSENGQHEFDAVKVPVIDGYVASQDVPAILVTPDTSDSKVQVSYRANGQNINIDYVDKDGNTVATQNVQGVTGQTVNLSYNVPEHWQFTQDPVQTYTFKGTDNQDVKVLVQHILTRKDDDKRTVTRTVVITLPNGSTTSQDQTATFTRETQYDEVTGNNIYGNWDKTSAVLPSIDVPVVPGYAPTSNVPEAVVNPDSSNQKFTVTYVAQGQNLMINYVDDNNNVVSHDLLSGQTGQTIKLNLAAPNNWIIKDPNNLPETYTFKANDNEPISIKVAHRLDKAQDDTRTITRIVTIAKPDGSQTAPVKQTVTFTRTKEVDAVTGDPIYGDWSENGQHKFDAVTAPAINGYAIDGSAPEEFVTPDSKPDETIEIGYVANGQSSYYQFIDDDKVQGDDSPDISQKHLFAGKTDQTVALNISIPYGYNAVSKIPANYVFKASGNDPVIIHLKHQTKSADNVAGLDTKRTVSRTVNITKPDGKTTVEVESVDFTRPATQDAVTGDITYGSWNKQSQTLNAVPIEDIPGYKATGSVPELIVTPNSESTSVSISYLAQDESTYWQFVDDDAKSGDGSPDISQKHQITGKTDQTFNLDINLPANYVLSSGQVIPKSVTLKATNNPILIHVKHATENSKGAKDSDDTRTISRVIKITQPVGKASHTNGQVTMTTQSVQFTRSSTRDLVTGKISYGEWSDNGKKTLAEFTVPIVPGYTATVPVVSSMDVTPDTKPIEVDVNYTANDGSQTYVYTDDNGNTVGKQVIKGKTDQEVKIDPSLPKGWVIANPDKYPKSVIIAPVDKPVTIILNHGTEDVSNDPSLYDKTHSEITRVVTINVPNSDPNVTKQSIIFTRPATKDSVTGEITYGKWSENGQHNFDGVKVPVVNGYTADLTEVPEITVTPDSDPTESATVNYSANPQKRDIQFVDDQGKPVDTVVVNGKTGDTVPVDYTKVPKHWVPSDTNNLPKEITFGSDDKSNAPIVIKVNHKLDKKADETRTVTRNITIVKPNGTEDTKTQSASFKRDVQFDEVTNQNVYGDWDKDSAKFSSVEVPDIDGYTKIGSIPEITVNPDSGNINLTITYKANGQNININYTDANGHVISTQNVQGKTGETVPIQYVIPKNWQIDDDIVKDVPKSVTFTPSDNPDITIHVSHIMGEKGTDTREVTRTITIVNPNNTKKVVTQKADFTRSSQADKVTGAVIYGDWDKTNANFDAIDVPIIKGYTRSQDVPAIVVNPDSENINVTVSYKPNNQSVIVNYKDDKGNTVGRDVINGKTGETVTPKYDLPDNWKVDHDGDLPKTITFGSDQKGEIDVLISHVLTPEANDTRTITRVVTITTPDGKTITKTQEAKFTRTRSYDKVLQDDVFGDWDKTSADFDEVVTPTVPGYTANGNAPKITVTPNSTAFSDVMIDYKADAQSNYYKLIDDDRQSGDTYPVIDQEHIFAGKTGETVELNIGIPKGYKAEGSVPTEYTFLAANNTPIEIHVKHVVSDASGDKSLDTHRSVYRVIEVTNPDGTKSVIDQKVDFTRPATRDAVSGKVTYGNWDKDTKTIPEASIKDVPGYITPVVKEISVNPDTKVPTVTVTYTAKDQQTSWKFNDDDFAKSDPDISQEHILKGKTGETVATGITIPKGYETVSQVPDTYTFSDNNQQIVIHLKHRTSDAQGLPGVDDDRVITRHVVITKPDGKTTDVDQSVEFKRPATKDEVTGKVAYGKWDKDTQTLPGIDPDKVPGYTVNGKVPSEDVTADSKPDSKMVITYTANPQTNYWQFVDDDYTEGDPDISQHHVINGVTDQTVDLGIVIPKNYVAASAIPTTYKFGAENSPILIHLKHATANSKGAKDSDDSCKVIRVITITDPHTGNKTITQEADFSRDSTRDLVSGKISYGKWNKDSVILPGVDVPDVAGYTKSLDKVPEFKATPDDAGTHDIHVTYTANEGTQTIIYQDPNTGKEIGKQVIKGKTDETVPVKPELPNGWKPSDDKNYPKTIKIPAKDTPITINITHNVHHIDHTHPVKPGTPIDPNNPDGPKYPKGLDSDDLNKTVGRDVVITMPDGTKQETKQEAHLTRDADFDPVTGKITYTDWKSDKDKFDAVPVPNVPGYTPNIKEVPEEKVTSEIGNKSIDVHYSQDYIPTPIPDDNHKQTDADKYKPIVKPIDTTTGKKPNAEDGISNLPDLPSGTRVDWSKEPDTSKPGHSQGTATITYPDGSKTNITIDVNTKNPAVIGQDVHGNGDGKLPDATSGVKNWSDMPDGTRAEWTKKPDAKKAGQQTGEITVTFPDGEAQTITVNFDSGLIKHKKHAKKHVKKTAKKHAKTTVKRNTKRGTGNGSENGTDNGSGYGYSSGSGYGNGQGNGYGNNNGGFGNLNTNNGMGYGNLNANNANGNLNADLNANSDNSNVNNGNSHANNKQLPQTGRGDNYGLAVAALGLCLISLSVFKKRKED